MAYQSTHEDPGRDTNTFYRRTLHVLSDAHIPFLVGGSHAYLQYTGIVRDTKDFDLFVQRADVDRALEALRDAGYRMAITSIWFSPRATASAASMTSGSRTRSRRMCWECR